MINYFKEEPLPGLEDDPSYNEVCVDNNHNPPTNIVIPEGKQYRHICPTCKTHTVIKSNRIFY